MSSYEKKNIIVPILDLDKLKKNHKRSYSEEFIKPLPTSGPVSISVSKRSNPETNEEKESANSEMGELLTTNRETSKMIKEIKKDLDMIKVRVFTDDIDIRKELKEIKREVSGIIIPESPKMISRCDAIVGNTQSMLTNMNKILSSNKKIAESLIDISSAIDEINRDNQEKYRIITSLILSLNRDIDRIQWDVDKMKK
jgi:hypothetical protein